MEKISATLAARKILFFNRIFKAMAEGKKTTAELAQACGLHKNSMTPFAKELLANKLAVRADKRVGGTYVAFYELIASESMQEDYIAKIKIAGQEYVPIMKPTKCDPWALPREFFAAQIAA